MKTYNTVYSSTERLKEFVNNNVQVVNTGILVQVFTHSTEKEYINKVINDIKLLIRNAKIIGATTAGEIMDCSVLEQSTVISITVFEKTFVETAFVENNDSFLVGVEIAQKLIKDDTKVLILFSDGLITNGDDILEGIHSVNKDIIVAGGRAADYGYMNQTYIFNEDVVIEKGIVGAALNGDIIVNNDYSFCWQPIGKVMTVTKSIKDRIYTIDDILVKDLYEKYLGKEVSDTLPKSATEFPFVVFRDGMLMGRVAFFDYTDKSLGFIGNVKEGDKVSFGYGNVDMVTEKSIEIFDRLKLLPIESIYVYSCTARRVFMQKKIDFELVPLRNFGPTSGFFTYGEFYHNNSENQLLNMTTTILCLSESNKINEYNRFNLDSQKKICKTDNFVDDKNIIIIRTLSHLAQTVTKELEIMNKNLAIKNEELKENQNKIIEVQRMSSLGVLAAGVAHNLKTPLATISSSIITLGKNNKKIKENPEGDIEKYTNKIEEITERIESCVNYMNNIILAVKEQTIAADKLSNTLTLKELIDRIKVLIGCTVKDARCKMNFILNISENTTIRGEIASLVQVINNLVSNSIDSYEGKGGNIDLIFDKGILKGKDSLVISIKDFGKGIDEVTQNKIFNKMITTKGTKGTGIGLFVSKSKIKSSFDGDLTFSSESNKGTIFNIIIPI